MTRSAKQLKQDAAGCNVSNGNEKSCVQQKIFLFVSGLVRSKKMLNGKRSFFAKRNQCGFKLSCYLLQTGYIEPMV